MIITTMGNDKNKFEACRACLKPILIMQGMLSAHEVLNLLVPYTSVHISEDDGLPPYICKNCYDCALQAYEFIKLCEQSDRTLRTGLNDSVGDESSLSSGDIKLECDESDVKCKYFNCDLQGTPFIKHEVKYEKKNCISWSESVNDITGYGVGKENELDRLEEETGKTPTIGSGNMKYFKCKYCGAVFLREANFLKHEKKHGNEMKCYICEKKLPSLKLLRSHMNMHNRKGCHLCQMCGKQFTLPENLVRHQRIHMGIRPYKCRLCTKTFVQSNELKSHMITHSAEKTHLCNVCGNKYARHMSLKVHMRRLHSDDSIARPFSCEICSRAFKDKRDLKQHVSIHRNERKHKCKVCGKSFNRNSNLKVHERIHTGHRPFACHICEKTFIQKHVLNSHLRTHPPINKEVKKE